MGVVGWLHIAVVRVEEEGQVHRGGWHLLDFSWVVNSGAKRKSFLMINIVIIYKRIIFSFCLQLNSRD